MPREATEKATPITITFPPSLIEEIDEQARRWFTNRSAAFTRIYLEWKQANLPQLTAPIAEVEKC